jgi:hypothetical protein
LFSPALGSERELLKTGPQASSWPEICYGAAHVVFGLSFSLKYWFAARFACVCLLAKPKKDGVHPCITSTRLHFIHASVFFFPTKDLSQTNSYMHGHTPKVMTLVRTEPTVPPVRGFSPGSPTGTKQAGLKA